MSGLERAKTTGADEWQHGDVLAGRVRLHVVRSGSGTPVVLLHGFPDFWFTWRYQIPALADAGFAVVAPDLRGYNTSEKPPGVAAYDVDVLAADVARLIETECGGRAHLVGHDWGGIVAWHTAMLHPLSIDRLVIVNAPHPAAFARDFWTTDQWRRSWYVFFFQIPWLPEALLGARNFRALDEMLRKEVYNVEAFSNGVVGRYKEAMANPGARTGPVNYYRAAFRRRRRSGQAEFGIIDAPTLVLWGDRDPHLRTSIVDGLDPWVPNLTVRRFAEAGHWLHLDRPREVSEAMIEFFAAARRPAP